ncbi:MAG TPA: amidohydrolase family protein [Methylomirabilota bacterium]|nr:amidohydrolase family protein [Methylomirabilota bacterium]
MVKKVSYLDLKSEILQKIKKNGGWVNAHAHLDRAYSLTKENYHFTAATLQEKWNLNDELKLQSSVDDIYDRMALGVERMLKQDVRVLGTFIDVDNKIQDKAIKAAQKIRDRYKNDLQIKYINQVHYGVLEPEARKLSAIGAEFVDIIGGLPERDKGREAEHLDVLFDTAKSMNKMVHVHIDQFNDPNQRDTELLVKKTIEHGLQGKVVGIHGISIGAHGKEYRQKLYKMMKEADVMMVASPLGWIDTRRNETLMPFHNALTPVDELVPAGITIALGTDNIADIYKPFINGSMWEELHTLLEATHFYDIDELVKIATVNGRKVLGIV